MEKLKPCPFCGGEVVLSYSSKGNYAFRHKMYGVCPFEEIDLWVTPIHDVRSLADAKREWNKRSGE